MASPKRSTRHPQIVSPVAPRGYVASGEIGRCFWYQEAASVSAKVKLRAMPSFFAGVVFFAVLILPCVVALRSRDSEIYRR
ncbi:hypothetical protein [Terriglobus roseus]|uniref:hypothetical protein n=1 Tax=Terriglobus roseus TaxID=392734 RepID=UPI0012F703F7|nr:hypothetical protein [Terriglobus roseus]